MGKKEIFKKLETVLAGKEYTNLQPSSDPSYQEFIKKFPKTALSNLTLDDYCLGRGTHRDNFCRWIERGLENVLGRYSPGSSRGHLIYRFPNGELYKHKKLKDLSKEAALNHVLKVHDLVANANVDTDVSWLDDNSEIIEKAEVEPRVTMGGARKARLLAIYNPDKIVPISSTKHLGHFLQLLEIPEKEIPSDKQVVSRLMKLADLFNEFKQSVKFEVSPVGFMKGLYSPEMGISPSKKGDSESVIDDTDESLDVQFSNPPLNQILFGPPGTGKTYHTTTKAVKLAEPEWFEAVLEDDLDPESLRSEIKNKYDQLCKENRIVFTTFHQSFAYEDFIEGIRARTEGGQIHYHIEDGIFKKIASIADVSEKSSPNSEINVDFKHRKIWKMSLGNTLLGEVEGYDDCIAQNYIGLGYGDNIDFSNCNDRSEIDKVYSEATGERYDSHSYNISAVNAFKNKMKVGDIVIISNGNYKFRAIAEITGEYTYSPDEHEYYYNQRRAVNWLNVFDNSLPCEVVINKSFSQRTIYQINDSDIHLDQLKSLTTRKPGSDTQKNKHVLIIDEINRGNISQIFGELITLLEPDKRKDGSDERSVVLPYSKDVFTVPDNLYILGTMNTADKSLAHIDLALRRRFEFIELSPDPTKLEGIKIHNVDMSDLLCVINQRIEVLLDRDHTIGHAYFWPLLDIEDQSDREHALGNIFERRIIPLLQEYFFSDWERIAWVLNDIDKAPEHRFIKLKSGNNGVSLFSSKVEMSLSNQIYTINEEAFLSPEAYQGIFIK